MNAQPVTFGWAITPTRTAKGTTPAEKLADATALRDANRAYVEALPQAFTTLWFEDHFQWGSDPTFEALTTASFFAALCPRFRIGTLVLGQRYRSPALTAKMAANLQLLSGGRFILGLGAGWKRDEHEAYGLDFPRSGVRIDQLDEAIRLIKAMFSQSPASFTGAHYSIRDAYCEPRPSMPFPIMVGGNGDRTLRVTAAQADMWNGSFLTVDSFAEKKSALARHCAQLGRDARELELTYFSVVDLTGTGGEPQRPDVHFLVGGSTQVADELQTFVELGVRHFMLRFADFPATAGLQQFTADVLPRLRLT